MKILALFLVSLFVSAHPGETDGFGCHINKANGTYHCHSGPLNGRTFVNKQAALNAMMALEKAADPDEIPEEPVKAATAPAPAPASVPAAIPAPQLTLSELEPLRIIAWSARHMDKDEFDPKAVAQLVAIADIVVLNDVNIGFYGRDGVSRIAQAIGASLGEKICRAVSITAPGAKTRSAYIWKDRKIALLKPNGLVKEVCDPNADVSVPLVTVQQGKAKRDVASASFYVRHAKQFISVAPVGDVTEADIVPYFQTFAINGWPALVIGDFKKEPSAAAFTTARQMKFVPVFNEFGKAVRSTERGFARTYDNYWVRGLGAIESRIVDLAADYPDLDLEHIKANFSDRCPIYSEFLFPVDEDQPTSKRIPTSDE